MKHSLKNLTMLAATALTLSVSAAYGQSLVGKVPFEFKVGKTTLPAGEYKIASTGASATRMVQIRAVESGRSILAVPMAPAYPNKTDDRARLVFRCYSDGCALAEVWRPGDTGLAFKTTRPSSDGERTATVYLTQPASGE